MLTHQKIRAILKKEGFDVGHSYSSGRISGLELFSGGIEITKSPFDKNVFIGYSGRTSSLREWTEKDEEKRLQVLENVKKILEKHGFAVEEDTYCPSNATKRGLQKLIVKDDEN